MALLKHRKTRGAPRLRIDEPHYKQIRFTSTGQRKIHTTSIFDISETGISFLCSRKVAPEVDEIVKMEFVPVGSVQLACMGRVIRIETPNTFAAWENFPETVKVGVQYYQLPKPYQKVISSSLKQAFSKRKIKNRDVFLLPSGFEVNWLAQNWQSVFATAVLLIGAVVAAFMIWDNSKSREPASPEWSKNLFERIKSEK